MEKITVSASRTYDILIGSGLLKDSGKYVREVSSAKKAAVVTDDNVDKFYSETVIRSLEAENFTVVKFVFPHGEHSKSHETLLELYEFLAENDITRTDLLIALGGGVVGDLTGFAAASYLRGVDFVQIPTSLLAQVDSSVGGKTAVNIKAGKNLVGAFNQPVLVLADTDTLNTLTDEFFADGMGEVVKYGMIRSEKLFELLMKGGAKSRIAEIIKQCVEIKRDVVQHDEHDTGERMILNFGHTLGHAIEKYYNYSGITHGNGVAIGMAVISGIAEKKGMVKSGVTEKLVACLKANNLPYETEISNEKLFELSLNDKKRASSKIRIILCPEIGKCEIKTLSIDEYKDFLTK